MKPAVEMASCVRTLRLKVKAEAYAWLNTAAVEVNQVWNWANETAAKALRPYTGKGKWLSGFDLCKLSAGAANCFARIGADTIQRIDCEYARKRSPFKKGKLRWRVSRGTKRSLGWVPFKAAGLKRKGKSLRFAGRAFGVFERERLDGVKWMSGCFAQDSVGDCWLCVPVKRPIAQLASSQHEVGIDLGLKSVATTSDSEKLAASQFFRESEQQIAQAQRRGHKRQARRLHRTVARRRADAQHKFSRKIVDRCQNITVGDVSSLNLVKTRRAKSVLDAGWGQLKTQLQYKGQQAGRRVQVVNEAYTTRTCSGCGSLTGPKGLDRLAVRTWVCSACGDTHDRDVNAARNILSAGRCPPTVCGNESSSSAAPPRKASGRCEARTSALTRTA